ncbi:MAG: endonuclease/exonuclease/phosphatase family protein, partial [Rhodothermia bacterium]
LCSTVHAQAPPILVDGRFDDWEGRIPAYDGTSRPPTNGIDFGRVWIETSSAYLLIAVELDREFVLQEGNRLTLLLDTDMDAGTGSPTGGIGAELVWAFGDRRGAIHPASGAQNIGHADIGLIAAPTVSSTRFEIAISLDASPGGWKLFPGDSLRFVMIDRSSGNQAPAAGEDAIAIAITRSAEVHLGTDDLRRRGDVLRMMAYNIENDGLFDPARTSSYDRIFKATNPDVILFVEIREHSHGQTADRIEQFLPSGPGTQWFSSATGSDIVIVSRFPILRSFAINQTPRSGNSAFLLDLSRQFDNDLLVVGAHLPCCGNDDARQDEADELMAFIRDAIADGTIANETPFMVTGDLNLVGDAQQLQTLVAGEIVAGFFKPSFEPDWDGSNLSDLAPPVTAAPFTYTWMNRQSSFHPGRLDFFIYSDAVTGVSKGFGLDSRELSAEALVQTGLRPADTRIASDHLPIVADFDFRVSTSTTRIETRAKPLELYIYPNPSAGRLNLRVDLSQAGVILIRIRDVAGRLVKSIDSRHLSAGRHDLVTDLDLPSGVYIATLLGPTGQTSAKFVVFH